MIYDKAKPRCARLEERSNNKVEAYKGLRPAATFEISSSNAREGAILQGVVVDATTGSLKVRHLECGAATKGM
ncbi:hypothetical protein GOBAR_AA29268 [Gossypium barbadense]|uniref:Uncharacterized protein n=1 Tax=Gossypium barbadense TaxID=3634 RepID=A0A2P5WK00_GOSBA|nr:hypothetical protein GOBAR_AA29268 [Gossypium barbadense]